MVCFDLAIDSSNNSNNNYNKKMEIFGYCKKYEKAFIVAYRIVGAFEEKQ